MKCISLFSGAGGLDVGAEQAGAKIVLCVENDHDSAETLRKNSKDPQKKICEQDVQEVDFLEFRDSSDDHILIGGPPCQPFSKNGYWVKNVNRLIDRDPRNMLSQFLRAVDESRPVGFLFENVESLMHPSNKQTFEQFLDAADQLGYHCTIFKANSADFGVPQKRKRVFVFGVRGGRSDIPQPQATHSAKPNENNLKPYEGVGTFIEKFDSQEFFEPQEIADHGTYYPELTYVPPGENYIALSKLENYSGKTFKSGGRFWNFLNKLHPERPSITIAAQPGPWVGPFHWSNRRLRVPEIAAIQMFPEEYQFYGTRRSIQKQIGNAVPVLLGKLMVKHLIRYL